MIKSKKTKRGLRITIDRVIGRVPELMLFSVLNVFVSIDMVSASASASTSTPAITDRTQVDQKIFGKYLYSTIWSFNLVQVFHQEFFSLLLVVFAVGYPFNCKLTNEISTVCSMPNW